MIRLLVGLALLLPGSIAIAEETKQISPDDVIKIAEMFGDCGGMFEHIAGTMESIGKPDLAKAMHEQANGALMAGAYLVYQATGKVKSLKEVMPFVRGRADVTMTRLRAAAESNDTKVMLQQQYICDQLGELQEKLISELRQETFLK